MRLSTQTTETSAGMGGWAFGDQTWAKQLGTYMTKLKIFTVNLKYASGTVA